jgi:CheY-like chemotaxis protein/anti-sigma regulatory factor (Ser/Thr protein kinase)
MVNEASEPVRHILVVDDEPLMRTMLTDVLESNGYTVSCARDGVEGLERVERERFDLVLADVWMPRMTGLELLSRMKALPGAPRAIVMTGDSTPATVLAAIREQAYQYISKPFTLDILMEMVRRVLSSTSTARPIEVVSATPSWVELLVPCEREAVGRIHDFLMHLKSDLPEDVRNSVGQAFQELLLNAVEWGGQLDPTRTVRISFLRARRVLVYRIADPGSGFRFDQLAHSALSNPPDNPIEHAAVRERRGLRPGGLGILMTRAIVDELIYNEAQNEVVFMKYLDE